MWFDIDVPFLFQPPFLYIDFNRWSLDFEDEVLTRKCIPRAFLYFVCLLIDDERNALLCRTVDITPNSYD